MDVDIYSFSILLFLAVSLIVWRLLYWVCPSPWDYQSDARDLLEVSANQQEDIYNISSRVQGQEQGQWPTHDNHVSLDHFTITNEINKYNDDPPTYEEAMRIAASNNNNTVVAAVPKTNVTPTSTSTSTANQ
ncbi:uncharacterized protein LOC123011321 isoform X5 [Tribolium madens]|uniref:uncharacterized protein LOC123011321 isoform X5 n=1 Tax=Tribolium madens TaxID=41895 RepID=UPI001CF73160|nr:uncharacterized protein LOC123011321 isoform X5 [Tribolium madens]